VARTLFIRTPRLGISNLMGESADSTIAEDTRMLSPLFGPPVAAAPPAPHCDVLLVYCALLRDGAVRDSSWRLIDVVRASGAPIAVVASKNAADSYAAATKMGEFAGCNLVMTVDRRGPRFGAFLIRLFSEMFTGTPIRLAWEKFAPQVWDDPHADCPILLFAATTGNVAFQV
jgi:hypothetical protein